MIKKILIGAGIAFAILVVIVAGLFFYIVLGRDFDSNKSEVVAKSLSPNGSIQVSVVRHHDKSYDEPNEAVANYSLILVTPHRIIPRSLSIHLAGVVKRVDCKESLSVHWKDNQTLEIRSRPIVHTEDLSSEEIKKMEETDEIEEHQFGETVIRLIQAPRIRAANCP